MSRGPLLAVLVACAFWPPALAQEPPAPARVGSPGVVQPRLVREVTPVYPEIARGARVQGVVILEATIDAGGRVSKVLVIRSIPLLDDAAVRAVRQWEFVPPFLNGQATPVVTTIDVNFTLPFASAPAPRASDPTSPSGMPADFAVVYREPCLDTFRHVLTSSTHDLEDIYRAFSTAGLLSGAPGLRWRDSSFVARTTVLLDRIEVVVPAEAPVVCARFVYAADVVKLQAPGPVTAYELAYEIDVRADGMWTQLWAPARRELQTPENEQRLRPVRDLIQKAIAGK